MAPKGKSSFNLRLLIGLFLLLLAFFLYQQISGSLLLWEKDRITIGVYGSHPYIYSYNPTKRLAFVVQFDPSYQLNVPGGYGWYKLSSLDLLGKIEGRRAELLRLSFGELIGSPVDYVYYPKKAALLELSPQRRFRDFYTDERLQIYTSTYTNSITNWIDKFLIRRVLAAREDRLVFLNTDDLFRESGEERRYDAELLDSRLKGLFYFDSFLNSGLKAIVATRSSGYLSAKRILRQIEGVGIKVIEIEVNDALKNRRCQIMVSQQHNWVARKLANHYHCQIGKNNSNIVRFVLNGVLEKEFGYN